MDRTRFAVADFRTHGPYVELLAVQCGAFAQSSSTDAIAAHYRRKIGNLAVARQQQRYGRLPARRLRLRGVILQAARTPVLEACARPARTHETRS